MAYTSLKPGGYVKFVRGTYSAWNKLVEKDDDTLYFIFEKDSEVGKLYLGEKLICGTEFSELIKIEDILLNEDIEGDSLLIYDGEEEIWTYKSADELIDIFAGAAEHTDGISGLVPAPAAGQHNLFLMGNATWENPVKILKEDIKVIAAEEVARVINESLGNLDTLEEIVKLIQDSESLFSLESRVENIEKEMQWKTF